MAIQITRKEQQVLRKLKAVVAAEQADFITGEMLQNVDPGQTVVDSLVDKGILFIEEDDMCGGIYTLTKEQLQVQDDDPEVEQAWEDFRAVQGDGSMTKLYDRNRKAEAASKHLEEVLFKKGRLVHMVSGTDHIWVTEDKVEGWKKKGWKEGSQAAVPSGL